ncbi:hypothetical protein TIFTF001_005553 [Ficus carica]|uniref:Uncharacterized protein n=1 Tax=Ficus carica TaxID=3494 RepID=A0AA88CUX1_FICCA|nr:hypothetical protein TIFTF001_005553 [Ficus carica]
MIQKSREGHCKFYNFSLLPFLLHRLFPPPSPAIFVSLSSFSGRPCLSLFFTSFSGQSWHLNFSPRELPPARSKLEDRSGLESGRCFESHRNLQSGGLGDRQAMPLSFSRHIYLVLSVGVGIEDRTRRHDELQPLR